jgi:predicted GIY-YIG superfamily endonuclease
MDDEERDRKILQWRKKARSAARKKQGRHLYVITLDPEVLWLKEFRQENPGYIEGMPCVYVGMTIHDPGDRFEQHKAGYRSSKYPRRYGVELALELIDGFDGEGLNNNEREAALADWLRDQGCAVWQN